MCRVYCGFEWRVSPTEFRGQILLFSVLGVMDKKVSVLEESKHLFIFLTGGCFTFGGCLRIIPRCLGISGKNIPKGFSVIGGAERPTFIFKTVAETQNRMVEVLSGNKQSVPEIHGALFEGVVAELGCKFAVLYRKIS